MNLFSLPHAVRTYVVRHQAAVTGAVFAALLALWCFTVWGVPQREAQAGPMRFDDAQAPLATRDTAAVQSKDSAAIQSNDSAAGRARLEADSAAFQSAISRDSLRVLKMAQSLADTLVTAHAIPPAASDASLHAQPADSLVRSQSDRMKGAVRDSLGRPFARVDSTKKDSVIVPRDSTARVEQFHYKRPVSLSALPVPPRGYAMFLKQPVLVQTEVRLDSTGRFVIVRETFNGKDTKLPVKMPLSEYVAMRFKAGNTKNFEDLVLKATDVKKRDDLGELLTSFTNIDIPIPANPVFSIFGPPRINLHISGAVDIRAAFRNTTTDQVTTSALGNSRSEPDFAQEVQINVSGTIGVKLNILADWNTQRQFEYENQLKIKYSGYEDEIVQSVEAGNVSLPTSSRFISSSSALFGIKAVFQLGPLKLTAVASQKKGQVQEKTVTGGSAEVPFQKKAYDYSRDHFFIDVKYIPFYENYVQKRTTSSEIQIKDYEVWITNTSLDLTNTRKGIAYLNLDPISLADANATNKYKLQREDTPTVPGSIENGTWTKLVKETDYKIDEFGGYITLNRATDGMAVALAYRVEGKTGAADDDLFYGTLTNLEKGPDSVLVLKLIKPKNLLPQDKVPWHMMMKNFYPLGGRKIQKAGFTLDIVYKPSTGEPTPKIETTNILQLFGLDKFSEDGSPNPDGKFDYTPGTTIDEERGEIIFPTVEPFRDGLTAAFQAYKISVSPESYIYPEVYDTTVFAAQNASIRDRFVITGKTTAGASNTVNLGFNIVENSVIVTLNGAALTANVDYTVDYIIGQVIIKNQAALVPGADLKVKFEQNDLFQLASKTLLGLRGDVNLSERTQFGFTMMNLDQQTLSDKVRLGEEPMKNSIYGFDGKTGANLPFLTKAIDALPFIETKANSDISVFGEAAYMRPDPNTMKSPIPIDDGKSIAYIDDFEGAKRTIPLGVSYGLWHDASPPAFQENVDVSPSMIIVVDTIKMYSKGRSYWYNVPNSVTVKDLYGDKKTVASGQEFLTVMSLNYDPRKRGEYNYNPDLSRNFGPNASSSEVTKNWSGVQRVLSSSALDLVRENVNFIELWVKVDEGRIDTTRRIFIDLGAISEDVIPNRQMDTEDQGSFKNGILGEDEDTGIDGITNDKERADHADFLNATNVGLFPELTNDPAGDDWHYTSSSSDYSGVNGTENNKDSEIGKFPDTEDLNHNNVLDRTNSYFEYQLNLDTNATNPQRVGGGLNGWYQYRIPLIDFKNKIGAPDFSLIEYVRVWMTGFNEPLQMRLYDFNLVGNQWEEIKKNDSTFVVSTINVEDNLDYIIPPGVVRARDKSQPDQNIVANEQSLQFKISNMHPGDSRQAIKRFTYKALDVFNYREMKMFVHGDPKWQSFDPKKPKAKLFVRFGRDSLNYYEYRAPIISGENIPVPNLNNDAAGYAAAQPLIWKPQNNVDIIFNDLTKLKQGRDSLHLTKLVTGPVAGGPDSSTYGIYGNPDLTQISFISVGVENPDGVGNTDLTGDVWINELRLADVDNTPGWAYSVSASLKIADLATVGFTYSKQDPYFHQLETAFGSRTTSVNWNLTGSIALDKFLPASWAGTSFPLTFSHSEATSSPLYLPASDVLVTKAAEQQDSLVVKKTGSADFGKYESERLIFEAQTITINDSYALPSFKVNIPVDRWYIRDIFNKMQFGFNYSTSFARSPQREFSKSWSWQSSFGYAYSFSPDLFVTPLDIFTDVPVLNGVKDLKLFFPITNFSLKLSASRAQTEEKIRFQAYQNPMQRSLVASRGLSFGWKLTENGFLNLSGDYSLDIASTLVHLETDWAGKQRSFVDILGSLFMKDQLLSFGIDNSYSQNVNINTRPRLPEIFDINKFVTLSMRYGVGYSWSNNTQLGELGKSTRWSNNISVNSDLSLKPFVETWWMPKKTAAGTGPTPGAVGQEQNQAPAAPSKRRNRDGDDEDNRGKPDIQKLTPVPGTDTTSRAKDTAHVARDTTRAVKDTTHTPFDLIGKLSDAARIAIKTPFLDFDKISMTFTETNSSSNTGVPGRPGFANFFGRLPFFEKGLANYGPTWAYQMGFVSDPTSNISNVHLQPKFPFIGFGTDDDILGRALLLPGNSTLPEAFTQNNKLTFKTNRDLWQGARIDMNWNVGWDYSRTQNIRIGVDTIDAINHIYRVTPSISGLVTGGSIERSFFSMPFLKSKISDVGAAYTTAQADTSDHRPDDQKLSESFEKGFESLPFLRKLFGQFMPRMNYSLRWDGLETYSIFKSWATRVSLDHSYQSTYRRTFKGDPSGIEVTESQRVSYGFAPLLGMSVTFKELLKGNMSANLRYSTTSSFDLMPSSKNISEAETNEISFTASYGRSGFEIPFFGLALNNDIDISFSYSFSKNSRMTYATTDASLTGTPGEGSSRTTMEPRIKYVLSSRVTASLFYRYTKIAPDAGGSRIPGSSTNEGGLDVHIAIQ